MGDKIQVSVRVRPVLLKKSSEIHWACKHQEIVQVDPVTHQHIGKSYRFNHVFPPETLNRQMFETVVQPVIDSAMDGFNVTVFAYGQTCSGKTHTMTGTGEEPGMVQLAINHIFDQIHWNLERAFTLIMLLHGDLQ